MKSESSLVWTTQRGKDMLAVVQELAEKFNFDKQETVLAVKKKPSFIQDFSLLDLADAVSIIYARRQFRTFGDWVPEALLLTSHTEQASHPILSAYHAEQFKNFNCVLEACSGLGFDTMALARCVKKVVAIERNSKIAAFARHNLALLGINNVELLCLDFEQYIKEYSLKVFDGLWADPARRDESGRRYLDPRKYGPPVNVLLECSVNGLKGIKLNPSCNIKPFLDSTPQEKLSLDSPSMKICTYEWIGFDKECKEKVVWIQTETPNNKKIPELNYKEERKVTIVQQQLTANDPPQSYMLPYHISTYTDTICDETETVRCSPRYSLVKAQSNSLTSCEDFENRSFSGAEKEKQGCNEELDKNIFLLKERKVFEEENLFLLEPHNALRAARLSEPFFLSLPIETLYIHNDYAICRNITDRMTRFYRTNFFRSYKLINAFPFSEKKVGKKVNESLLNYVYTDTEIKKIGIEESLEELQKILAVSKRRDGGFCNSPREIFLLVTKYYKKKVVFILKRKSEEV
jgi:hypothetical protein